MSEDRDLHNKNTLRVGILAGTTASGKTALALEFARRRGDIEILNADSIQVYRGFDVGSAKPSAAECAEVPHHLIDIRNPDEPFNAGDFVRETNEAIEAVHARGHRALIVGGTGFYLKALLYGMWEAPPLDPEKREKFRQSMEALDEIELWRRLASKDPKAAEKIHRNDRYRLIRALEVAELSGKKISELELPEKKTADPRLALWVLDRPKEELEARIQKRARAMVEGGLIEETQKLMERWPGARPLESVGYDQVVQYLSGKKPPGRKVTADHKGLIEEIALATRQLCKRQRTWFNGEPASRFFTLDEDASRLQAEIETLYA